MSHGRYQMNEMIAWKMRTTLVHNSRPNKLQFETLFGTEQNKASCYAKVSSLCPVLKQRTETCDSVCVCVYVRGWVRYAKTISPDTTDKLCHILWSENSLLRGIVQLVGVALKSADLRVTCTRKTNMFSQNPTQNYKQMLWFDKSGHMFVFIICRWLSENSPQPFVLT